MVYYSNLSLDNQESKVGEDIYVDIQRYRALVDILVVYNDKDFALEETKTFNNYLSLFDQLMNRYSEEDLPEIPDDVDLSTTINDSIKKITPEE